MNENEFQNFQIQKKKKKKKKNRATSSLVPDSRSVSTVSYGYVLANSLFTFRWPGDNSQKSSTQGQGYNLKKRSVRHVVITL